MLQGESIRLRHEEEADLEELYRRGLEPVGPYFPFVVSSETTRREAWEKDGRWGSHDGQMLIVDDQGQVVGAVMFERVVGDVDEINIGYYLYPEYRGRGYASEALGLFARYLFATRSDMNRARLDIHPDNTGSIRVAERCGFTLEGRIREGWFNRGTWQDTLVYGLLRRELDSTDGASRPDQP